MFVQTTALAVILSMTPVELSAFQMAQAFLSRTDVVEQDHAAVAISAPVEPAVQKALEAPIRTIKLQVEPAPVPTEVRDVPQTDFEAPLEDLAPGQPVTDVPEDLTSPPIDAPEILTGAERRAVLDAVSIAMSSVETATGRFSQMAADFSTSEGTFYLRRPGRVRFEYDDPVPILIVADGATVAIEDRDLETQDRVPLRTTPLGLILDDQLDFAEEAEILNVRRTADHVGIAMQDKSGEMDGVLEIILDAGTYDLVAWRTEDEAGGLTTVTLADVVTGERISPRLFRIEDPNAEDERD